MGVQIPTPLILSLLQPTTPLIPYLEFTSIRNEAVFNGAAACIRTMWYRKEKEDYDCSFTMDGTQRKLASPFDCLETEATIVELWRTVTNVSDFYVKMQARVKVDVEPLALEFTKTTTSHRFKMIFHITRSTRANYKFGKLTWVAGRYSVRIPIAVCIITR